MYTYIDEIYVINLLVIRAERHFFGDGKFMNQTPPHDLSLETALTTAVHSGLKRHFRLSKSKLLN